MKPSRTSDEQHKIDYLSLRADIDENWGPLPIEFNNILDWRVFTEESMGKWNQ